MCLYGMQIKLVVVVGDDEDDDGDVWKGRVTA